MPTAIGSSLRRRLPLLGASLLLAALASGCTINTVNHNYGQSVPGQDPPKKPTPTKKPTPEKPKPTKPTPAKPKPTKPAPTTPAEPGKPTPVPDKPSTPAPAPEISRLVVPVRVPFETLVERIDALLPKSQSQDYKRVTKEGQSPHVEVKYKAWRDPIQASFSGKTLRVVVPIRYAANIRAKVKNPLGGDWIQVADNQTWGTAANPQRMRITIELNLGVDENWKVTSVSKLDGISHSKPPTGNFCGKVGIDICVPKEDFAPEVREHLNAYLVPKIKEGLARADGELTKSFDLGKHAQSLWTALQMPLQIQKPNDKSCPTELGAACKEAAWVVVSPLSLGMSQLKLDGDDLGVDLSLEAKIATVLGGKPNVKVKPLPKLSAPLAPTAFQLRTSLSVPLSTYGTLVQKALGTDVAVGSGKLSFGAIDVAVDSGKEITLSLAVSGAHNGKLVARGKLAYDAKAGVLELANLDFDAATQQLFAKELKGLDVAALKKKLLAAATFDVGKQSTTLRRAVSSAFDRALPGKLEFKGTLSDVSLLDFTVSDKALQLRLELEGSLGVEYTP